MTSIKLYLDKRKREEGELCPISIILSHKNKTLHIPTGIKTLSTDIDEKFRVVRGEHKQKKNSILQGKMMQAQRCLFELNDKLDTLDIKDIKRYILADGEIVLQNKDILFADKYIAYINENRRRVAADMSVLKRIGDFADLTTLRFEDITYKWLTQFNAFLVSEGLSTNAITTYMRNISAVFNAAINDDETTAQYPFRRFKMKRTPTRKRNLSVEDIRNIYYMQIDNAKDSFFRDMFMLSFFLVGMNTIDMAQASVSDIMNNRIEYTRSKTQKQYSIFIHPEAQEIIDRNKGTGDRLLSILDRYSTVRVFATQATERLKRIDERITMYWARHTWASIAFEIGISTDVIALALGHAITNRVTSIYINPNLKKVDDANRQVIDYVLNRR